MMQFLWKSLSIRRGMKIALGMLTLFAGLSNAPVHAATAAKSAQTDLVYVGMNGNQVHALRFDPSTGKLAMIGPVAGVPKPRWAVSHPQLPMLYVANEGSAQDGSVIAFAVDRETGSLTQVNEATTGGSGTTHLWLDMPSRTLMTANFGGGSTSSIALNRDGNLGTLVSTVKSTGSGPHRRQASPHAHGIAVDPSGRYALVSDLGADRVFVYGFDRTTQALSPDNVAHPRSFAAPAGSGPRHIVFGVNGRFVYLLNELTAEVMVLRWDMQQGHLSLVQSLPTSSAEFQGVKSGSEIAVSQDGRFVYVANRSENALMVYRVNPDSGALSLIQRTSSGGEMPWNFAIHPSGKWMLVANERSSRVNVFSIDASTGMVSDTGHSVDSPAPVSITFVNGGSVTDDATQTTGARKN